SRPTCGFTLPGDDGKRRLWVDRERGLVLKAEQFAVDGRLAATAEVVALEINGPFDNTLLTFTPPPGTEIEDRREQPLGVGTTFRVEPWLLSLDEAESLATFHVRVPTSLPAGFELESVQLWWLGMEDEDRP